MANQEFPEPTADQRVRIRELLDKYFDDELGMYAKGYTDQRIAEEVGNLPWAIVSRVREVGWGPIRVTEQLVEARQEVELLKEQITKQEADYRGLLEVMQQDIVATRNKVIELSDRLKTMRA